MSNIKNIAVFGSGAGSNARNLIEHFEKSDLARVKCIISNKKEAGILRVAKQFNVEHFLVDGSFRIEHFDALEFLQNKGIDVIVLAGFLKKIPDQLTRAFPNKIINIHPSLLPKFGGKGMYGKHVHEAVYNLKEKQTGITIHFVNEEYDEGTIIFQASVDIDNSDDIATIEKKVKKLEKKYFPQQIEKSIRHGL